MGSIPSAPTNKRKDDNHAMWNQEAKRNSRTKEAEAEVSCFERREREAIGAHFKKERMLPVRLQAAVDKMCHECTKREVDECNLPLCPLYDFTPFTTPHRGQRDE